jgi:hypothetical protein
MAASRWMVTRWRVTTERHNDESLERGFGFWQNRPNSQVRRVWE